MFYFKTDNQITVYFSDGKVAVWNEDNVEYERVYQLCLSNQWIKIQILHNEAKALLNNTVTISDNTLTIGEGTNSINIDLNSSNKTTLMSFIKLLKDNGIIDSEIERIKPFLINMFKNTHINAVHEIYDYCKAMDFEITEDGCFIAYKKVRKDLGSIYDSGKTKHAIGQVTKVDVFNTNRNMTCSSGLHFCSKSYLSSFMGDVTIAVKVNPQHVVSIPVDYNFAKGRCSEYVTIGILGDDGTLQTTNIEALTNNKVKIVKTKVKKLADKKLAKSKAKSGGRINETASLMEIHNNDVYKVADIMLISVETVKRNMRKHRSRNV